MHIAVCSYDRDERYALSRLLETALLRRGVLPKITLFHMPQELLEAVTLRDQSPFDFALVATMRCAGEIRALCGRMRVVLLGEKRESAAAFEWGAAYFIESPICRESLDKALARCLDRGADKASGM